MMNHCFFDKLEEFGTQKALLQDDGSSCTYHDIVMAADNLSQLLAPRSLVFVLCTNTIASITGYLSFLRCRAVPVLLAADIDDALLQTLLDIYQPGYLYCPQSREMADDILCKLDSCIYVNNGYRLLSLKKEMQYPVYDELALLLTTSGSTGSPKFVRLSYENIESNAEAICEYLEIDKTERPVTTLPMYYTYGLSVIHSHLCKGAAIVVTDKPVIRKEFWELVEKERVTSLAGVPYTYEVLKKIHFLDMELPVLKTLTQAGGKLSAGLHKEFAAYAERTDKKFIVMYGQTEATARMSYLPSEKSLEKCGSIGIPIPGGRFSLEDSDGKEVMRPDLEGELIYHGKNVALGYAGKAEDLGKENEFHYVLHTGDMAKMDAEGYYYITGRKKRFLKLYGSRVNLDEIDQIVKNRYPQIECVTVGSDRKMFIYITSEEYLAEVRKFIIHTTHINAAAVETRFIPEIPKSPVGKILYNQLKGED